MDFRDIANCAVGFVLDPAVQDLATKILVGLAAVGAGVKGLAALWRGSCAGGKRVAGLFRSAPLLPELPPAPLPPMGELCLGLMSLLEDKATFAEETNVNFGNLKCGDLEVRIKSEAVWDAELGGSDPRKHMPMCDTERFEDRVMEKIEELRECKTRAEKVAMLNLLPRTADQSCSSSCPVGDFGEVSVAIDPAMWEEVKAASMPILSGAKKLRGGTNVPPLKGFGASLTVSNG